MLKADKKKSKLLLAVIALLFVMGCASQKYVVMTKDVFQACKPVSAFSVTSSNKPTKILFLRYQNCYEYKDLLIIAWRKYNIADTRAVFNHLLPRYLKRINKEAILVQYERWDSGLYLMFDLSGDKSVIGITVPH